MKRLFQIVFCFCLLSISIRAQQLQWIKKSPYATFQNETTGLETDQNGNIYTAGNFFNDGALSYEYGIFIKKADPQGNTLWEHVINAGYKQVIEINSITSDNSFLYISGRFSDSTITLGNIILHNDSVSTIFLAKYDLNGNAIWAKLQYDVTADDLQYQTNFLYSAEYKYLRKHDLNGNLIWSKTAAKYKVQQIVSADPNHIYLRTGDGNGPDPDSVHKYDLDGNKIWSVALPGYGKSITADSKGNCYVTSEFLYGATFDNYSVSAEPGSTWGCAIAKLDSSGAWQWAIGTGSNSVYTIYKDSQIPNVLAVGRDSQTFGLLHEYDDTGLYQNETSLGPEYEGHFIVRHNQSIYIAGQTGGQYPTPFIARIDDTTLPLNVKENSEQNDFTVYPNPASEQINILLNNMNVAKSQYEIRFCNLLGETVAKWNTIQTLNVSGYPKGIYYLELITENERLTKKVVIQ